MKAAINGEKQSLVESLMANDFQWTTSEKITYKPRIKKGKKIEWGKKFFWESIDKLPKDRIGYFLDIDKFNKINETKYIVTVHSRLKVRKGVSVTDNINWKSHQAWEKFGDKWLVSSIKDVTKKSGNRGTKYFTNPVHPKKPVKRK